MRIRRLILYTPLFVAGCTMIPPEPSGRVLLRGQSETEMSMVFRTANDKVEEKSVVNGKETVSTGQISQEGLYPLSFQAGWRSGFSDFGTEIGLYCVPLSLEVSGALRQSLWRPLSPDDWALALQGEALSAGAGAGAYSLSASLAATRDWWILEPTLAVRYGVVSVPEWGPPSAGGFGPSLLAKPTYPFVDLVVLLKGGRSTQGKVKVQLLCRLPAAGSVVTDDETFTDPYSPYNVSRYVTTVYPGYWIGLTVGVDLYGFLPYSARNYAVPRKWTPRASPDEGDLDYHLKLARKLAAANMPADAADEYQEVLRLEPRHVESHIALAGIYLILNETEMALFHAQRAVDLAPLDPRCNKLLQEARRKMERNE